MTAARAPRPECDVAIVRQHTPVETWVDSTGHLLCIQIVGDRSIVVLGLTDTGADMLMRQIEAGLADLRTTQANLAATPDERWRGAGGQ